MPPRKPSCFRAAFYGELVHRPPFPLFLGTASWLLQSRDSLVPSRSHSALCVPRTGRLHSLLDPQSLWPSGEDLRLGTRHSLAACCWARRWSPRPNSWDRRACLGTQGRSPFLPPPSRKSLWTPLPYEASGPTPAGECDLGTCFHLAGLALLPLAPSFSG